MIRLAELKAKRTRIVAGLMTGTSMDGLDVAICRIETGNPLEFNLLAFETMPFPEGLREDLEPARLASVGAIARMNSRLGAYFADALQKVADSCGFPPDLIGSHGQTVYHEHGVTTLQLGDPCPLAARFGCPVVHDFRMNDIAFGGSGAPLVPYVDRRLLGGRGLDMLIVNIGGIANFTALPKDPSGDLIGMDCGPGNMVLDELVRRYSNGQTRFDRDGRMASRGQVDRSLLALLMDHPFIRAPLPKSAGREQFGSSYVDLLLDRVRPTGEQAWCDLLATAAELTACAIVLGYKTFVLPRLVAHRVIVGGGGSRNPVLMNRLQHQFGDVEVVRSDEVGLPMDAKEAIAFAVLASDRIDDLPTNIPSVTGASEHSLLGKITEC